MEVYSEGRLLAPKDQPQRTLQQLNDWRAYSPDGPFVSVGYFIRAGAVWTTKVVPVPGPAGRGSFKAVSVAVSTDEKAMAVVTSPARGRQTLYVGGPGGLRRTVTGSSLTRPAWAGTEEVWTVRNGDEVLLVTLDGQTTRVDVPDLGSLGTIRALRLSRDGTRVAVVAGPPGRERLWIGVVVRENGAVQIDVLRPLDIGESPVSDVSWADSLNVVALVRDGRQDSSLYAVATSGRLERTARRDDRTPGTADRRCGRSSAATADGRGRQPVADAGDGRSLVAGDRQDRRFCAHLSRLSRSCSSRTSAAVVEQ